MLLVNSLDVIRLPFVLSIHVPTHRRFWIFCIIFKKISASMRCLWQDCVINLWNFKWNQYRKWCRACIAWRTDKCWCHLHWAMPRSTCRRESDSVRWTHAQNPPGSWSGTMESTSSSDRTISTLHIKQQRKIYLISDVKVPTWVTSNN